MAGEWRVEAFENAPVQIIDGDRGTNYPDQTEFLAAGHCLFLNAGNVTTTGFRFSDCAFITAEKDASLRKGKLVRNDVILTTRGTVGNAAYFDESIPFNHIRINSGMVILRAQTPALHPRYLYLFVRSALFHAQVSALRTGSAQPQLPIQDIKRIEIPIPPPHEQCAIAHILGTLDDKIELNRGMNETLEGHGSGALQVVVRGL
jgi:type I restriction enzyme S subunit